VLEYFLTACIPAEESDFEIDHFRNFQTSVTLTLDQVIWHTAVYHSLTPAYQISLKLEKLFVDVRMYIQKIIGKYSVNPYICTYGWTDTETSSIMSTRKNRPKN